MVAGTCQRGKVLQDHSGEPWLIGIHRHQPHAFVDCVSLSTGELVGQLGSRLVTYLHHLLFKSFQGKIRDL